MERGKEKRGELLHSAGDVGSVRSPSLPVPKASKSCMAGSLCGFALDGHKTPKRLVDEHNKDICSHVLDAEGQLQYVRVGIKCADEHCNLRCCCDDARCIQELRRHFETHLQQPLRNAEDALRHGHSVTLFWRAYFMAGVVDNEPKWLTTNATANAKLLMVRPHLSARCTTEECTGVQSCARCKVGLGPAAFEHAQGQWLCVLCFYGDISPSGRSPFQDESCCLRW